MFDSPGVFLADFGVPATVGTSSGLVILDTPGQMVLGDSRMAIEYSATYNPLDLGTLTKGAAMTIDGVSFKVRMSEPLDDGVFWRTTLEKV